MQRVMSRNGYTYVEGNPVNYTDPSGEFPFFIPIILAGATWALGYLTQEVAAGVLEECNSIRTVLDVAGEVLGWNSLRYSINVLRSPNASFGDKAREAFSAVFHTALGINFVQSLGQFAFNVGKIGWKGLTQGWKGIQSLGTQEGLQQLVSVGRVRVTNLLPNIYRGYRSGMTALVSGRLNVLGRISTALHEGTHLVQADLAGSLGNALLNASRWTTSTAETALGGAARILAYPITYAWNPAELQAIAQGGNIMPAVAYDIVFPYFIPLAGRLIDGQKLPQRIRYHE